MLFSPFLDEPFEMKKIADLQIHDISDDDDDDDDYSDMKAIPGPSSQMATTTDDWLQRPNKLQRSRAPVNLPKTTQSICTMETSLILVTQTATPIPPLVHAQSSAKPSNTSSIVLEPSSLIEATIPLPSTSSDIPMVNIQKFNGCTSLTTPSTTAEPELVLSPAKLGQ